MLLVFSSHNVHLSFALAWDMVLTVTFPADHLDDRVCTPERIPAMIGNVTAFAR